MLGYYPQHFYIETESFIAIHKNVKNILILSEEMKLEMHPMSYPEFLEATGSINSENFKTLIKIDRSLGTGLNKELMKRFRIYMAVGGMPQAVETYLNTNNLLSAIRKS